MSSPRKRRRSSDGESIENEENEDSLDISLTEIDCSPIKCLDVRPQGSPAFSSSSDSEISCQVSGANTDEPGEVSSRVEPSESFLVESVLDMSVCSQSMDGGSEGVSENCEKPVQEENSGLESAEHEADTTILSDDSENSISDSDDVMSEDEDKLSDDDANFNFKMNFDPYIYREAPITVNESMTAILSYIIRHETNKKEIVDLLNLVNLHCREEDNMMKTSLYFFKKYFAALSSPVTYHHFCSVCYAKLGNKASNCPNFEKHKGKKGSSVFVELPLVPQLGGLFGREEFYSSLQYPYKRKKAKPSNIEDVQDGQLSKELVQCGFLSEANPLNFTMILNGDGVPVFASSNDSLWPIFLNILELPPSLRFKKENCLIAGLWFGSKPSANLLLEPLLPSFEKIWKGFEVKPFGTNKICVARGVVLSATSDLPAKAMLMGMINHNGSWGCKICKTPGGSVKIVHKPNASNVKKKDHGKQEKPRESSVWVYKYSDKVDLRRNEETIQFGKEAHRLLKLTGDEKTNVMGVKYPSAIFNIMYDAIRGFGVDDLHTLHLGLFKKLMSLWFDVAHRTEPFSCYKFLNVVDSRLLDVKLPNFVKREMRSIEQDMSHWKGLMFMVFGICLSIPLMDGIMSDRYLEHHVDVISCIYKLSSKSISPDELLNCDQVLNQYLKSFESMYGTRHMTMVIHLLQHLVYVVNNVGPLLYNSCYIYEGLNAEILKMIHGTRYVETQIASATYLISQLPLKLKTLKSERVKSFCYKILHPSLKLKKVEDLGTDMFSVGAYRKLSCVQNYVGIALEKENLPPFSKIMAFSRLKKGRYLYVSRSYRRSKKTNSHTSRFLYKNKVSYGGIDIFVKVSFEPILQESHVQSSCFAIVQLAHLEPYKIGPSEKIVPHINRYFLSGEYIAVPIENLQDMMFHINVEENSYVCEPLDLLWT